MTAEDFFSIDELARAAGMTARNVRAYRTKGLLQPPVRTGRASQYRTVHLRRLRDIRELREAGLPLKLIMAAARAGEDLGPGGRLRRLAEHHELLAEHHQLVDVRPGTGDVGSSDGEDPSPATELPQPRDVVERLQAIGLPSATAALVYGHIAMHGAALAADLGDAVSTQAPAVGAHGRGELADLTGRLTGQLVRQALATTGS